MFKCFRKKERAELPQVNSPLTSPAYDNDYLQRRIRVLEEKLYSLIRYFDLEEMKFSIKFGVQ